MMTNESDAWLERTFETATRQIPLPPDERWLPAAQPTSVRSPWAAVLTIAALIIAIGFSARIASERARPASTAVATPEDAAWQRVVADSPNWVTVLRPAWLPADVLSTDATCGSPVRGSFSHPAGTIESVRAGVASYAVDYHPDATSDACAHVRLTMYVEVIDGAPVAGVPKGRASNETIVEVVPVLGGSGQIVTPNERPSELRLIYAHGPFVYRISANGLTHDEFVRLVQSLREIPR